MTKKMTYAQAIDFAYDIIERYCFEPEEIEGASEAMDRLTSLQAQLAKRNGSGKKGSGKKSLTKAQKENVGLKNQIVEILNADGMTATEVGNAIGETCQRASALLKQLIDEGLIERVKDGRKTIFRPVAEAEVEEDLGDEEN